MPDGIDLNNDKENKFVCILMVIPLIFPVLKPV